MRKIRPKKELAHEFMRSEWQHIDEYRYQYFNSLLSTKRMSYLCDLLIAVKAVPERTSDDEAVAVLVEKIGLLGKRYCDGTRSAGVAHAAIIF